MTAKAETSYTIGGVKVEFPVKAYPSQISMMDKVIRGCQRAQNCLLESPTGSGKTLALLCGAIAWQKAEFQRLRVLQEIDDRQKAEKNQQRGQQMLELKSAESVVVEEKSKDGGGDHEYQNKILETSDSEEAELFKPPVKKTKTRTTVPSFSSKTDYQSLKQAESVEKLLSSPLKSIEQSNTTENEESSPENKKRYRTPKIFFGTRTHKQISQVVSELRRTNYQNTNTCILSSRTHSCIQEINTRHGMSKNELCHELLDPRTPSVCKYHRNLKQFVHPGAVQQALQSKNVQPIWDLEDLIKYGKQNTVCPYFAARELMLCSDVVFCPYNYLIDPIIRKNMNISLKGDIIILDEAHNIEESCREAASFTISQDSIFNAIKELEETLHYVSNEEPYRVLVDVLCSLSQWIDQRKNEINDCSDYDHQKLTMLGHQAVDSFESFSFGPKKYEYFLSNYHEINGQVADRFAEESEEKEPLSGLCKNIFEGLQLILGLLYNQTYTNDYHVVLTKILAHTYSEAPVPNSENWFNTRKKPKRAAQWNYELNFCCFNPGATFYKIKENARCIILTSGTLSPMDSFQSELDAKFPITLEANHVIDPSQCWIGSVGVGPNKVTLDGKFASTSMYEFQDELGELVLEACSSVPHGVLCFLTSYSLLDKLYDRWTNTAVLYKIMEHKVVMCEPRKSEDFESTMKQFYETIESTSTTGNGAGQTGALFLAVCRGKVSEGLDFSDKNARIVITVGIPFPSIKDFQVTLKRSYNDKHQHSRGLLSGSSWYEIQAYRALNQALGRCIRHRRDWGAILLVDSRFSNKHYYKSLSKWVRNKVKHYCTYNEMTDSLQVFIEHRLRIEKQES